MKTNFTREEILTYIKSHNKQLDGENILNQVQMKSCFEIDNIVDSFKFVRDMGYNEGKMQSRMEMIESMLNFFEIEN